MDDLGRRKLMFLDWVISEARADAEKSGEAFDEAEIAQAREMVRAEKLDDEFLMLLRLIEMAETREREAAANYLEKANAPAAATALRQGNHRAFVKVQT